MYYFWFFCYYALTGSIAGYIGARFHKLYHGTNWITAAIIASSILPLFVFGCFLVVEIIDWYERSSDLMPMSYMIGFTAFTSITNTWLVSIGCYFGYYAKTL